MFENDTSVQLITLLNFDFMILRLVILYCFTFFSLFSHAQTNVEFENYLNKQDSLMNISSEMKDAVSQIKLAEGILSKYDGLSDADKETYKDVYIGAFYSICSGYSLLNNKIKSIEYFKKSINAGFIYFDHVIVDPDLENIRNEKEFKELLDKAQNKYVDSLKTIIKEFKKDTITIKCLLQYANFHFSNDNRDSAFFYYSLASELSVELKYEKFQTESLRGIEQVYAHYDNFQKALELNFKLLQLCEKINDSECIANTWLELGGVYDNLGDSENSILYNKKAYSLYKYLANNPIRVINSANNIGYKYTVLHMPDSALHYFQESNALINNELKYLHPGAYAFTLYGLAKVNYQLNNLSIAMPYYKQSLELIDKRPDANYTNWIRGLNFIGLAELFKSAEHADSSIFYYSKALQVMPEKILIPNIYRNLAELYKNKDKDLAFDYLMKEAKLRDSLHNATNQRDLKNLTLNEQERQKDIAEKHKQEESERKQNIQYALIGLGILTFIMLFLLLGRSFITNTKLIIFLGVIALLLVFEFLNLLLHPFLEKVTNHSPVLMLIALVCIAALLVPLHHRLEKWSTQKLVEKNKEIRLSRAKQTIEKLS